MNRIAVADELFFADKELVCQYDRLAKTFMVPLYKYFVWKILRRGIKRGRVLEMGTGPGLLPAELARVKKAVFDIVAIDISPNMINKARENTKEADVPVQFQLASGAWLPFRDDSFDLVVSQSSLHMWSDPVAILGEMYRVARKGGVVLIRDGRRLQSIFPRLFVWWASRFMTKWQRQAWYKAIHAGYTMPEVSELLNKSSLPNWRVTTDLVFFDLCIELVKE